MAIAKIRVARLEDVPGIRRLEAKSYPTLSTVNRWGEGHLVSHQKNFPDGQFVADLEGVVVGHCATFITRSELALKPHTFREITGHGTFNTHDASGDALYGAEIMVDPDLRRRGIGRRFYRHRFDLVRAKDLHYFLAGGRLPGYARASKRLTIEEYTKEVVEGKKRDRVLTTQLSAGLTFRGVLPNYLTDPHSLNYAALLVWENPDYQPPTTPISRGIVAASD